MKTTLRRLIMIPVLAVAASTTAIAVAPSSAQAWISNCSSGKVSDIRAWGACHGDGRWRLAISCTWGWSGKTSWVQQTSWTRVELQCGRGSIRSTWIEIG